MEILSILLENFRPDFVFSLSFFIAFLGFGLFFSRQVWPWFQKYIDKKLEYDYQINKQRWEVMKSLSDDVTELRANFSGFHENQRHLLEFLLPKNVKTE